MNEEQFVQKLRDVFGDDEVTSEHFGVTDAWDIETRTFEETGLLTGNNGVVVAFPNGDEFQVQVLQSEEGSETPDDKDEDDDDDDPAAEAAAEFDARAEGSVS